MPVICEYKVFKCFNAGSHGGAEDFRIGEAKDYWVVVGSATHAGFYYYFLRDPCELRVKLYILVSCVWFIRTFIDCIF